LNVTTSSIGNADSLKRRVFHLHYLKESVISIPQIGITRLVVTEEGSVIEMPVALINVVILQTLK